MTEDTIVDVQNMTASIDERADQLMRNALILRRHNVTQGDSGQPVEVKLDWHTITITVTIEPRVP